MKIHALRVDLEEPGIGFLVTPPNGERPSETDGLKTSTFLKKYRCQVAVNASPFRPVGSREGEPRDVIGLSVSRGERYSEPAAGYGSLVITRDRKARIVGPGGRTQNAHHAVGGFRMLLEDGRNVGKDGAVHPRTAVGLSKDGRSLFLLVIDGRQRGYSEGATTKETAGWLKALGAHQGLNLDGGGSTTMVSADGKAEGGYRLLNRPIHAAIPGTERVNGNHLGIFAEPLGKEAGSVESQE